MIFLGTSMSLFENMSSALDLCGLFEILPNARSWWLPSDELRIHVLFREPHEMNYFLCVQCRHSKRERKKVSNRRSGFSFGYFFLLSYRGIVGSHHTIHDCRFFFSYAFFCTVFRRYIRHMVSSEAYRGAPAIFFSSFFFFLCRLLIWNFGVLGVTRYIKCACGIILMLAQPVPGSGRPL